MTTSCAFFLVKCSQSARRRREREGESVREREKERGKEGMKDDSSEITQTPKPLF